MLDLNNKSACLFGLPDSGKSTLAHYIATQYGEQCFIYDTLNEYPDTPFDSYPPKHRDNSPAGIAELDRMLRRAMASRKYRLIIIDEANRYAPSKPAPLPDVLADLNDWRAHYELATIYIARRPVQLNQDLTDLAHYLIIFGMTGRLTVDNLNNTATGLGDAVEKLPPYHFIVAPPRRQDYQIMSPVPASFATHKVLKQSPETTPT